MNCEETRRTTSGVCGATRDKIVAHTGWPVRFTANLAETPAPSAPELQVLRELHARTARAHGSE